MPLTKFGGVMEDHGFCEVEKCPDYLMKHYILVIAL